MPITSSDDNIISYADHHYGKGQVKVARVSKRTVGSTVIDDFKEYVVDIQLYGAALLGSFTEASNKLIVPTDTIKNTVYIVASKKGDDGESPAQNAVKFAIKLSEHFVQKYSHITKAHIVVEEVIWPRLNMSSTHTEATHCFIDKQSYTHKCEVVNELSTIKVTAGIEGLQILKTHGSAFVDYWRDEYTTLKPASDRIMATKANLTWRFDPFYDTVSLDHDRIYDKVKQTFCEQFALHDSSQSVQHTIDVSGRAILNSIPELAAIELNCPNVHYLLSNLEPFKLSNYNEIFLPTIEPFGNIYATLVKTEHALKLFNDEKNLDVAREVCHDIIHSEKAASFILNERPFENFDHLNKKIEDLFLILSQDDYRNCITNMARFGDAKEKSKCKLIEEECRNLKLEDVDEMRIYNELYEKRFKHIFVLSATGKSKEDILESIKNRFNNDSDMEFKLCVEELKKIVRIRLLTVLNAYARKHHQGQHSTTTTTSENASSSVIPNISSHVLDLTDGRPAAGVKAVLYFKEDNDWKTVGTDVTNKDGRMTNLLNGNRLAIGEYKLKFLVEEYFRQQKRAETFYPEVEIKFKIKDASQKYHVPLLLNQYGYSTYRGS